MIHGLDWIGASGILVNNGGNVKAYVLEINCLWRVNDTVEKIVRLISNSNYIYFNVKADSTEFCHTILRNIAFISAACRRRRFHHPSPFIPTRFLGVARQPKIRRLLLSSSSSSSTIRYVRSFIIYARTYDVVKRDHLQLVPKGTHLAPSRTAT